MQRIGWRSLVSTVIAYSLSVSAFAQSAAYPNRPIHFIIPYTAGMIDTTARAVAQHLSERLGQPVVAENRPGASQVIALDAVAKSAPDGYTLVMGTQSGLILLTASKKSLPYDPMRDFQSITLLFTTPFTLAVNPALPVRTVAELIAYAKSQPGKLNYASVGPGSGHHLATEMFKTRAGIDVVHVPYKGSTMAQTGLMAGDVQFMFEGPTILSLAKSGKVRAIATSGRERSQAAPELPTVGDTLPGFEIATWFGLSAPAGVPRPIIDRLNREAGDFLRSAAARQKFAAFGIELTASTPEEMTERIRSELPVWTKAMRAAGIEAE